MPLIDPASLHFPQLTRAQLDELEAFYEEQFAGPTGACSGSALQDQCAVEGTMAAICAERWLIEARASVAVTAHLRRWPD